MGANESNRLDEIVWVEHNGVAVEPLRRDQWAVEMIAELRALEPPPAHADEDWHRSISNSSGDSCVHASQDSDGTITVTDYFIRRRAVVRTRLAVSND